VDLEEFNGLPQYFRMGVRVNDLNEVLLSFGKKSAGDRNFIFDPDELGTLEFKMRLALKNLRRITIDPKTSKFTLT
jgi:hypothetical protein